MIEILRDQREKYTFGLRKAVKEKVQRCNLKCVWKIRKDFARQKEFSVICE